MHAILLPSIDRRTPHRTARDPLRKQQNYPQNKIVPFPAFPRFSNASAAESMGSYLHDYPTLQKKNTTLGNSTPMPLIGAALQQQ